MLPKGNLEKRICTGHIERLILFLILNTRQMFITSGGEPEEGVVWGCDSQLAQIDYHGAVS